MGLHTLMEGVKLVGETGGLQGCEGVPLTPHFPPPGISCAPCGQMRLPSCLLSSPCSASPPQAFNLVCYSHLL